MAPELREWDYGAYEGLTTAQIRAQRPDWDMWRDGCPGGEDAAAVGARVDRLLSGLVSSPGDVALFAHGHVLRVLAGRWLGLPPAAGALLRLDAGSLSELGHERGHRVIDFWNDLVEVR